MAKTQPAESHVEDAQAKAEQTPVVTPEANPKTAKVEYVDLQNPDKDASKDKELQALVKKRQAYRTVTKVLRHANGQVTIF